MADVHLPHPEDDEENAARPLATARSKSLLRMGVEVLLISAGVFLGLMGEQWRERAQHRELAEESLRRFRTEILANRKAVTAVKDDHATTLSSLETYLAADTKTRQTVSVRIQGLQPVFFEHSAWDLALATQSLAYIDPELAFALSRIYTGQQAHAGLTVAIIQSTIYARSMTDDMDGYFRSLSYYFGDVALMEPDLLRQYDEVLPQIDRALGESRGRRTL